MAIVQMQRINICALKKNRKAILERLQELGAMEVDIRLEDEELCEKQDVSSSRSTFERRSQTADQALHILDEYAPEKKGMLDSLAGKPVRLHTQTLPRPAGLDAAESPERNGRAVPFRRGDAFVHPELCGQRRVS